MTHIIPGLYYTARAGPSEMPASPAVPAPALQHTRMLTRPGRPARPASRNGPSRLPERHSSRRTPGPDHRTGRTHVRDRTASPRQFPPRQSLQPRRPRHATANPVNRSRKRLRHPDADHNPAPIRHPLPPHTKMLTVNDRLTQTRELSVNVYANTSAQPGHPKTRNPQDPRPRSESPKPPRGFKPPQDRARGGLAGTPPTPACTPAPTPALPMCVPGPPPHSAPLCAEPAAAPHR